MAIKINGATTITNSRRGVFRSVNPGSYTTASRPPGASEGDVIYDSDEKNIFIWNGTEWIGAGGGQINNLNPAIPPFISMSGPETVVTNSDGKVEFSLDGNSWSNSITIPSETVYYCDWTNDILSAAHDSTYETSISVDYPNVGASQLIELELKIDKLPDSFSLDTEIDVLSQTEFTSNTISPLNSINAPTAIWGSSNADTPQIAIADGAWEALPTTINTRYVNRQERIRVRHTTGAAPATDYGTVINIGYGTSAGEYETSTFSTVTKNSFIDPPTITSPASSDPVNLNTFTVTSSPIVGVDYGTHASTSWQYANDENFTDIIEQSTQDVGSKTSWNATGNLTSSAPDQTRYVRAKYHGSTGLQSEWGPAYPINAVKFWRWQLLIDCRAHWGATGFCNDNLGSPGGAGAQGVVTLETSAYTYLPPGDIETFSTYGNGGGGNTDTKRQGTGGPSTAAKINGTVVIVSGGGGGGGPVTTCSGKDGATLTIGGNSSPTNGESASATASEWPNRPTGGGGGGGGGGATTNCGGNGGGGFGLSINTTVGNWKVTNNFVRSKADYSPDTARNELTLKNQFEGETSWANEYLYSAVYNTNLNGPIADILPYVN